MLRICKGASIPDSFLKIITSIPKHNAAPNAIKEANSKLSKLGLKRMIEPTNAIPTANQRTRLTFSFKNKNANIIANTGLIKLMKIASETGINVTAANIKVTPSHPKIERKQY
jgi:hypothetical protein